MNAFSQFLVEITWSLTMGILVVAGVLAAEAAGIALAVVVCAGLGLKAWRAWSRRRDARPSRRDE